MHYNEYLYDAWTEMCKDIADARNNICMCMNPKDPQDNTLYCLASTNIIQVWLHIAAAD